MTKIQPVFVFSPDWLIGFGWPFSRPHQLACQVSGKKQELIERLQAQNGAVQAGVRSASTHGIWDLGLFGSPTSSKKEDPSRSGLISYSTIEIHPCCPFMNGNFPDVFWLLWARPLASRHSALQIMEESLNGYSTVGFPKSN